MVLESQKISRCLVAYLVSSNLLSNILEHWWETSPNKAFKADSQCLAISVQVSLKCLRYNGLGLVVSVVHHLTRR